MGCGGAAAAVPSPRVPSPTTLAAPPHTHPQGMAEDQAAAPPIVGLRVFHTAQRVYLVGTDEGERVWRVLRFSRDTPALDVFEDPTPYTKAQCASLLRAIHHGAAEAAPRRFSLPPVAAAASTCLARPRLPPHPTHPPPAPTHTHPPPQATSRMGGCSWCARRTACWGACASPRATTCSSLQRSATSAPCAVSLARVAVGGARPGGEGGTTPVHTPNVGAPYPPPSKP